MEKYTTKKTLKAALLFPKLPSGGKMGQTVERISNAFAAPPIERPIGVDAYGANGGVAAGQSEEAGVPDG